MRNHALWCHTNKSREQNLRMNAAPDQTIIWGLQIFLDDRSLSSIDQKILITPMYSETMWTYHRKVKLNAELWEILVEESCKHSRRRARWCRDKISPFQNHKEITILAQVSSLVYTIETAQMVWFPLKDLHQCLTFVLKNVTLFSYIDPCQREDTWSRANFPLLFPSFLGQELIWLWLAHRWSNL